MEFSRATTRILMSKFEILQCNKIEEEKDRLQKLHENLSEAFKEENKIKTGYYMSSRFLAGLMRVFSFWWLGSQVISGQLSLAQCVLVTGFIGTILMYTNSTMKALRSINMEWMHVEKLWDFFDTTPCIKGMDKRAPFVL